jgi:hypothetical protein
MSEKIVSARAKWVLQEIIPVILTLGIGLLSLFLGITETFTLSGAIIGMVVGFGLMIYLLFENGKRKRRSTLFANLKNDENHNISVWMRKPNKDKWKGKLDEGKNSGDLAETSYITFEDVLGTRVAVISLRKDKKVYIPTRLIEDNDETRLYLVDAIAKAGDKVKFKNKVDSENFSALLVGNKITPKQTATTEVAQPSEEWKKKKKVTEKEYAKTSDKAVELPERVKEANVPSNTVKANVQATQVVGYGAYKPKTISDSVSEALDNHEAKLVEAERKRVKEEGTVNVIDSLLIPDEKVSSIKIDVSTDETKNKEEK